MTEIKVDINKLPNILQLIDILKSNENSIMQASNGWVEYTFNGYKPLHAGDYLFNSDRVYINDIPDDQFIVNRLSSKRYCLKPNLSEHMFLFRGQNIHYDHILSSFSRGDADDHLISNLRFEDFRCLLRSHPLFMMFERGIHLDPIKKPVFLEMNYYGLAQHYGFNTGLLDFTSDIWTAAFFACTKYKGNDTYEPITNVMKYPYGVIYVHSIIPSASFFALGFRSIGLQIYPRSGAQKGFFYEEGSTKLPVEQLVTPYFFKHDGLCSQRVFELQDGGKRLFPNDDIQPYAQEILKSKEITGFAFTENLYTNQDDFDTNLKRLSDHHISVNWHKQLMFTEDMLQSYYKDIKNGLWEHFCNQISFVDENEEVLKESLLTLPNNLYYRQFFDEGEFQKLRCIELADRQRAIRNSRWKKDT